MIHERPVAPGPELRALWPWVKQGLDKVGEKCRDDWMSEDVWASLRLGNSTLCVYNYEGHDIGFAVYQKTMGMDGPVLFVWACWFEPMRYRRHIRELMPLLDRHAQSIGAREIRHHSSREGWGMIGEFEQHSIIWRRKVKEPQWANNQVPEAARKP